MKNGQSILLDCLLALMLAGSLFFIPIPNQHDWGDDFAQYLLQAEEWKGQTQTARFIYNPEYSRIGPERYPSGWPLLLSLIKHPDSGVEMQRGLFLLRCCSALFSLLLFLWLRRYHRPAFAFIATALFAWHPLFVAQQFELLSDIPFALFTLAGLFFASQSERKMSLHWSGLAFGMAIALRSAGWVAVLASLFFFLLEWYRAGSKQKRYLWIAGIAALSGFGLLALGGYYSHPHTGYGELFSLNNWWESVNANYLIYENHLAYITTPYGNPQWDSLLHLGTIALSTATLAGLVYHSKWSLPRIYLPLYIGLILLYPFSGGYRFLLPILPLLYHYSLMGFEALVRWKKSGHALLIALALLYTFSYVHELKFYLNSERTVQGPLDASFESLYIELDELDEEALVLCIKPRAMAYYGPINTTATEPDLSSKAFEDQIKSLGVTHLLQIKSQAYPALEQYVNRKQLSPVYSTSDFVLYPCP